MAKEARTTPNFLSVDDLDAALNLLSAEAKISNRDPSKLVVTAISDIFVGFVIFGIVEGVITLSFSRQWGLALIASAILAWIVVGIAVASPHEVSYITKRIRTNIAGTEIGKPADVGWKAREGSGLIITLIVFLWLLSVLVLVWGCYSKRETIVLLGLLSGAACALSAGIYMTVEDFHEFRYFSLVSQFKDDLRSRSRVTDGQLIPVSDKEQALLSEVEKQQVTRHIARALEDIQQRSSDFYSIAITASALQQLEGLPAADRQKLRQLLDGLQTQPRPEAAVLTKMRSGKTIAQLRVSNYLVEYVINDHQKRIDVIDLDAVEREVPDDSQH